MITRSRTRRAGPALCFVCPGVRPGALSGSVKPHRLTERREAMRAVRLFLPGVLLAISACASPVPNRYADASCPPKPSWRRRLSPRRHPRRPRASSRARLVRRSPACRRPPHCRQGSRGTPARLRSSRFGRSSRASARRSQASTSSLGRSGAESCGRVSDRRSCVPARSCCQAPPCMAGSPSSALTRSPPSSSAVRRVSRGRQSCAPSRSRPSAGRCHDRIRERPDSARVVARPIVRRAPRPPVTCTAQPGRQGGARSVSSTRQARSTRAGGRRRRAYPRVPTGTALPAE